MRRALPPLVVLALLLSAPLAAGKTLLDFEEPHGGDNAVIDFGVTRAESGRPRFVVFLNPPSEGFGLIVYRADGSEAYVRNGTRGVQAFPPLEEGTYKFYVRGNGVFLLTDRHLDRPAGGNATVNDVNATLDGKADTYVMVPTRNWTLHLKGEGFQGQLINLRGGGADLRDGGNAPVSHLAPYVLILRGDAGAPYRLWLEPREGGNATVDPTPTPTPSPTAKEATPGPGALFVAGAVALVALALRRRT